jgi:hypothetical protein
LLQLGAQRALVFRVLLPLHIALGSLLALQMPLLDAFVHALFWFAVSSLVTRVHALLYRRPPFSRKSDKFSAGARLAPLLVSVPVGLLVMLLQMATFESVPNALLASFGLLFLSSAIGTGASLAGRDRARDAVPSSSDFSATEPVAA